MVNSLLIELLGIKFLIFWKINGLKYFFNRYESEGTPDFLIKGKRQMGGVFLTDR